MKSWAAHVWDTAKTGLVDKRNHVSGAFDARWARVRSTTSAAGAEPIATSAATASEADKPS